MLGGENWESSCINISKSAVVYRSKVFSGLEQCKWRTQKLLSLGLGCGLRVAASGVLPALNPWDRAFECRKGQGMIKRAVKMKKKK